MFQVTNTEYIQKYYIHWFTHIQTKNILYFYIFNKVKKYQV